VVQGYGGKGSLRLGELRRLALAKKYGVTRYPAIFVDDVLVATPTTSASTVPARRRRAADTRR
jgi:hypothetical protein